MPKPTTEPHTDTVRHSRRFVSQHPDRPDIHGIEFPSGRVLADDPRTGLVAATTAHHLDPDGVIIWADEGPLRG
ncbi:hypothetical protein AB0L80_07460 [Streptomyces sp. NPDC052069]|uniref:hypothetical protein n=1 Tax=Streptomyces sp. NPDC052069 TaxID=3154650 RepID=UPI003434FC8E